MGYEDIARELSIQNKVLQTPVADRSEIILGLGTDKDIVYHRILCGKQLLKLLYILVWLS